MKREFQAIETLLINMELANNGPPIYITQPLKIILTNTSGHEYIPPIYSNIVRSKNIVRR